MAEFTPFGKIPRLRTLWFCSMACLRGWTTSDTDFEANRVLLRKQVKDPGDFLDDLDVPLYDHPK